MGNKLREAYGRRITPSVKIMFIVVTILFALDLACAKDDLTREQQTRQHESNASFSPERRPTWNI